MSIRITRREAKLADIGIGLYISDREAVPGEGPFLREMEDLREKLRGYLASDPLDPLLDEAQEIRLRPEERRMIAALDVDPDEARVRLTRIPCSICKKPRGSEKWSENGGEPAHSRCAPLGESVKVLEAAGLRPASMHPMRQVRGLVQGRKHEFLRESSGSVTGRCSCGWPGSYTNVPEAYKNKTTNRRAWNMHARAAKKRGEAVR